MSEPVESSNAATHEVEQSALFSNLVMQQFSMAMMLMGRSPGMEGQQPPKDLEAARLFIDQLEMIEHKTKGNLTKEEGNLIKQTLMALQMAFVEAVEEEEKKPAKAQEKPATPATPAAPAEAPGEAASDGESHKKFTKKY